MTGIRRATLKDLEQLSLLFDHYRVFYEKESDRSAGFAFLQERINNNESVIFVAEEDGKLKGFVQLYPLFSSTRMKPLWLLNDLFVEVQFRGRGVSVQLIEKCKAWAVASGACGLILETAKTNFAGNQLYPRTGFVLDADHNYYSWDVV